MGSSNRSSCCSRSCGSPIGAPGEPWERPGWIADRRGRCRTRWQRRRSPDALHPNPMTPTHVEMDWTQPERVLWSCLDAVPTLPELQIASMLSFSLGAGHSYEARSMLWSVFHVLRPSSIVETGTNHGLTTAFLWTLSRTVG